MKLIILGGGHLTVKKLKVSKGITSSAFVEQSPDNAAILEKLKERSSKIVWADALGRIEWADARGNLLLWFLTNSIE